MRENLGKVFFFFLFLLFPREPEGFAVNTWTYVIATRTETSVYKVNNPNRKYDAAASSPEEMTDVWTGPKGKAIPGQALRGPEGWGLCFTLHCNLYRHSFF
jgi:hypothetical protein